MAAPWTWTAGDTLCGNNVLLMIAPEEVVYPRSMAHSLPLWASLKQIVFLYLSSSSLFCTTARRRGHVTESKYFRTGFCVRAQMARREGAWGESLPCPFLVQVPKSSTPRQKKLFTAEGGKSFYFCGSTKSTILAGKDRQEKVPHVSPPLPNLSPKILPPLTESPRRHQDLADFLLDKNRLSSKTCGGKSRIRICT